MIKLLLVEDDKTLSYMIKNSLEDIIGDYEVVTAANGKEGLKVWKEYKPEVILADIEMPEMNGYQMLEKIRETDGDTPFIFTSARVSSKDVTMGFKLGCTNYIKKPFTADELHAYIKALLNLKQGLRARNESQYQRIGELVLDAERGMLRHSSGEIIHLTAREALILQLLCINKGEVVKREAILELIWDTEGKDYFASRSLDVFVSKLRKKLEVYPSIELQTVKGIGIRLRA